MPLVVVAVTVAVAAAVAPPAPGFERAIAAFRDYAATVLQVRAAQVHVGPSSEEVARRAPDNVGRLWAFDATTDGKPGFQARGWAAPDGTVVSTRQNLGRFFDEAGLWRGAPPAANELADRLVWSLGTAYQRIVVFRDRVTPPSLTLRPDGSGTLTFLVKQVSPPPGRPIEWVYAATVTIGADRRATFALSENLNR